MPNYKLGKIYTVQSLTSPEIYVGSTCMILCKRMTSHRSKWKKGLDLGRNKEIVKDINEWYIELYENYPCDKVEELTAREGVIIREIGTLNKNIAGRTAKDYYIDNIDKIKEYYIENADKIKEQKKEYYIDNIDKIKENRKEYRIENADKIKEQKKEYYIENADKIKEQLKEYYIENADNIKKYQKEYRIENADNIKENRKEYYIENADKIKEKRKQRYLKNKLAKSQIITE